jgi:mevalonate kinase
MSITSTSPGKVILSGEHAVVYGYPAIVAAVQMRTRVTVGSGIDRKNAFIELILHKISEEIEREIPNDIQIGVKTTLPIGSGLGSSASVAAGIVGGISEYFNLSLGTKKINEITYEIERLSHGNPSGVDNTAVVYGGLLRFERGMNGKENKLQSLEVKKVLQKIWLIDSGKPEETTGDMVQMVRQLYGENPSLAEIFDSIGTISNQLQKDMESDRFSPEWITENERLLERLGVVGDKAKNIIDQIEKIGGYAKICGAGGIKFGSGVILVYHPDDEKFEAWLKNDKYKYFQDHLGGPGWQIERYLRRRQGSLCYTGNMLLCMDPHVL